MSIVVTFIKDKLGVKHEIGAKWDNVSGKPFTSVDDALNAVSKNPVENASVFDAVSVTRKTNDGKYVAHIGANDYPAVKIGNQLWLAKNLDENLGHLGNQYEDFTSTRTSGYYHTNSSNIGEVATIDKSEDSAWSCVVVDVKAGDFVKFNAHSGKTPKAYIYVDKSNVLKQIAERDKGYSDFEIQCDVDGKVYVSDANNYRNFYVQRKNVGSADEWYYNNDEAKAKANNYGRLYTWDNINANLTKLGLTKWRWPTTADFNRLVALDPTGKSYATFGNGTNTTGLSFVSSGLRLSDGTFSGNAFNMYSNVYSKNTAERLRYQFDFFAVEYTDKNRALSVRLVLDLNDDGTIPDGEIVKDLIRDLVPEDAQVGNPLVTKNHVHDAVASAISAKADAASVTGATKCKVTYNSQGVITAGADLAASDIPNLDASKITSGTFADERIASASKWNAKQDALTFDTTPTESSSNPVTSAGVKSYVDSAVTGLYKYRGSVNTAYINALQNPSNGDVYNINASGTITNGEGGQPMSVLAGDNVAFVLDPITSTTYWDKMSSELDLSNFVDFDDIATATTAGVVKSSSTNGKVSVDASGVMTVNGWNNKQDKLTEMTEQEVTDLINSLEA